MNANVQRALLLFDQSRHELAEVELRQALAQEPQDALAHGLLGLCLAKRELFKEATEEAQQAVHLAPDSAFAHYALASVFHERNHNDKALLAINEALRLDAAEPDYYCLLAVIQLAERRWQEALDAAERGLHLNSEHIGCTNLRAMALLKLGRKSEAGITIDSALAKDPGNSVTHANQGWTLLERGDPKKALEHFREALRLDPENEWARQGIIEALKARHFVYAWILKYFFWMSRLSSRAQWGIIVAGWFGNRLLAATAEANPSLAPWLLPARILYVSFVVLTWTADPLFNLMLRVNRFGRLVLSREQIVASNWVGSCILLSLLALVGCVLKGFGSPFLLAALVFGLLVLPLAGTFKCAPGWPRTTMAVYTGVMAAAGIGSLIVLLSSADVQQDTKISSGALGILGLFALGAIGSGWVANFLISQRLKR